MNIGQLIANPQQDLSAHLEPLEQLAKKNAFCSTTMMLYLKALKDSNSIDFENQLKKTAILCQDRSILFDFIKNTAASSSVNVVEKIEDVAEQNEISEQEAKDQHDTVIDQYSEVETEDVSVKGEHKIVIEEENDNSSKTEEKEEVEPINDSEEPIFELNKDIYARAVHASIHNEEEDDEDREESSPIESKPEIKPQEEDQEIPKINEASSVDTSYETQEEPQKEKGEGEKLSFLDWLKAQQHESEHSSNPQDEKEEVKDTVSAQPEDKHKQPLEQKNEAEDTSHRSEINAIVDKFIKEEPTITRKKAEFFSPSETAKKSIEDDQKIVTETLAEIYVKQGNYKKAIEAYEQLILKFPKKKSFFADRIEIIKKKRQ